MGVPQTCYDASVIKRVEKEKDNKRIFTITTKYDHIGSALSKVMGKKGDKEMYMHIDYSDQRKKHFEKGMPKYIEYFKDDKLVIFVEYTYKHDSEGFMTEMKSEAYWEGE